MSEQNASQNASQNARPPAEHPTLSTQFLSGVRRLDAQQWSRLVNTFGPIVYRWCRASGVSEFDAPDLVQEVFSSVARGIPEFQRHKAEGSFRSWLATITRNRVRDHFRKQIDRERARGGTAAMTFLQRKSDSIDDSVCSESIENPLIQQVLRSVECEFEAVTWRAFWLTAVESKTAAEVSESTGLSTASVYQAKSRVLRRLRQRLSETPS